MMTWDATGRSWTGARRPQRRKEANSPNRQVGYPMVERARAYHNNKEGSTLITAALMPLKTTPSTPSWQLIASSNASILVH